MKLILSQLSEFQFCGHARTTAALLELVSKERPHVLLLDLNLKNEDGFTILEQIKKYDPSIKVVILTMYDEAFLIDKAKKLKASAYLLKNSTNTELKDVLLHVIQSNEFYLAQTLLNRKKEDERYRDEFIEKMHLTEREIEIIRLVTQGKSAKEIANELFLSLHTVDTHRRNILSKLKLKNIADLTRFAYENKLI